jgi:hypothetical protein
LEVNLSELSGFWTTNDGTGAAGDQQASYTQAQWSKATNIFAACSGFEGVAKGYLNEYECTDGGAETVDVDTGGAVVDGKWVYNDSTQNITVTSAVGAGNSRIDRVVLRADWANFNTGVHLIAGSDGTSPSAPAVTQTSGTTYDIKLCQALVDTGGSITITDEREWATWNKNNVIYWRVLANDTVLTTGDGKDYFTVPEELDGMILVDFDISVYTVSSSGTPTVQLYNLTDTTDILSTVATIDESEYSSYTAATQPVIDTDHDDVATGDRLRIDVDVAGTDTTGLDVIMVFRKDI